MEACDVATNNLRVVFNQLPENQLKKDFAVCVKGLDFPQDDLSVRFSFLILFMVGGVEWLNTEKYVNLYHKALAAENVE